MWRAFYYWWASLEAVWARLGVVVAILVLLYFLIVLLDVVTGLLFARYVRPYLLGRQDMHFVLRVLLFNARDLARAIGPRFYESWSAQRGSRSFVHDLPLVPLALLFLVLATVCK